jgi:hypothetical protein
MVGKLYKYEILYYLQSLLPIQLLIPVMALLNRIIQIFETDTDGYDLIFGSSVSIFIIAILVCYVMNFVSAITRFYKNLFTAEGYLTMTLPVSETQHIFVKLTTAILFFGLTILNTLISVSIITSGEFLLELFKAIGYTVKLVCEQVGTVNMVFYIIEFILLVICSVASSLLLYYGCITIGQLAKKNRVAAAFGVYFIQYFITQVIATALTVSIRTMPKFYENIVEFFAVNLDVQGIIHVVFGASIVVSVALGAVYFLVSKYIMKNKLNLE